MVKQVPNIIFRLLDLGLERIIAEIIDNSLDKNANDIRVNFVIPNSDAKETMTVISDNGDGFGSVENLFSSMEIESDEEDIERAPDEVGKYHIGLKIAPLTKYSRVDIVTKIDEEIYSLTFFEPKSHELEFNLNDPLHRNPTLPKQDIGSSLPRDILQFIDRAESDWTTMVFLSKPYRKLLEESVPENKNLRDTDAFQENLRRFLGITYARYYTLKPDLEIRVDEKLVTPYDPFWKTFTPSNITSHIGEDNSPRATKLRRMSRFGTLEGYRFVSTIVPSLRVQPFVIPDEIARKHFKKILADGFPQDVNPFPGKAPNGGSFLDSNALAGFYFFRDSRLVAYGSFYELGITDHAANNIRIEISYDSYPGDDHFTVSPNKTRVDHISEEAYAEIYRGLKMECGSPKYAAPFSNPTPFFDSQNVSRPNQVRGGRAFVPSPHAHYNNTLVRGSKKWIQYAECGDGGCGLIHAPGDTCPEAPELNQHQTREVRNPETNRNQTRRETSLDNYGSHIKVIDNRIMLRLFKNERDTVIRLLRQAIDELDITIDELR